MDKINKYVRVTFRLPEKWLKIVEDIAERECTSRTEIIKNIIKSRCLRSDNFKAIK